jgi:AcrR family transcriptional regulator
MSKKLSMPKVPTVPGVPGVSRRQQYSASTKKALVKAAETLFTSGGYAATSLDAIVADAKVTKGALYHHFGGKQDLFESVFDKVEDRAAKRIRKALKSEKDPWQKATAGLRAFLETVQEPEYRRVVMQDGPAVLGVSRFREHEERKTYSLVGEIVSSVSEGSGWQLDDDMLDTFTQIFFGAMSAAGEVVSTATDPEAASARVEAAIGVVLAGLRTLVRTGGTLNGPATTLAAEAADEPEAAAADPQSAAG